MALPTSWSLDWQAIGADNTSIDNGSTYDFYIQPYLGIMERYRCIGGCDGRFPSGATHIASGRITSIETDGNYVTIYCENADGTPVSWVDGSSHKRWTGFGGTFNGSDLDGAYAADAYRIALDQDNGDDFNTAVYADIIDNGNDWVKVVDDGQWTLNRLLEAFVDGDTGVDFAIAAETTNQCKRPFHTERRPPRPNDFEWDLGQADKLYALTVGDDEHFTLTVDGETTASIPATASAKQIRKALLKLPTLATRDVQVFDYEDGFDIVFIADRELTADGADVTEPADRIYDLRKRWEDDRWTEDVDYGFDLMTRVGGKWKRIAVTASAGPRLKFDELDQAISFDEGYWLISRDGFWRPQFATRLVTVKDRKGRKLHQAVPGEIWNFWQWYYGVLKAYWSHSPGDDSYQHAHVAEQQVTLELGEADGFCDDNVAVEVFDVDYQISTTDVCNQCPDAWLAPFFWFGVRGIQIAIETLCPNFIERKTYTTETSIVNFTQATFFKKIYPANTRTATIASQTSGIAGVSWSSALPAASVKVHWTVINTDGTTHASGYFGGRDANAVGEATSSTFTCPYTFVDGDVGKSIVISWGWPREIPLEFLLRNRRDFMLPDEDEDGLVFPGTETHPGDWNIRYASTTYVERDKLGFLVESLRTFSEGDAAREIADGFYDPTTTAQAPDNDVPPILAYLDRGWHGIPSYQSSVFQPKSKGIITSGGTFWFRDHRAQWWETTSETQSDGAAEWHSFTATGGSNTTAVNSAWIGNGFMSEPGYYVDQILEAQITPGEWEGRPIKAQDPDTGTITIWDTVPPFSGSTAGKLCRIRVAGYVRNRWGNDRKCTFTKPDGTKITVAGKWSNDNTWYTTDQSFTFLPGWRYQFDNPEPGRVWHRKSSLWKRPYDTGVAQDTRGQNWRRNQRWNLPHKYAVPHDDTGGRFRHGDIISLALLKRLYVGINALVWTAGDVTYTNREDADVEEYNEANDQAFMTSSDAYAGSCTAGKSAAEAAFAATAAYATDGSPPYANSLLSFHGDGIHVAGLNRRYAYAKTTPPCPGGLNRKVTIWIWADLDGVHTDGQVVITNDGSVDDGHLEYHFNASGDGVVYHQWAQVASTGPTTAIDVRVLIGNVELPPPAWPPCPPPLGENFGDLYYRASQSFNGYLVVKSKAIYKWNVTGGLKFVDVTD